MLEHLGGPINITSETITDDLEMALEYVRREQEIEESIKALLFDEEMDHIARICIEDGEWHPESLKCNSSPDKHVFLYLFPDCLRIIIHFSVYPTTIRARVLCLFAQVCKRKNPISEPSLDLAVILVTSRYEDNTLPVNSEQ